jgi:two-component system, LytTR family, sensor kinase
MATTTGGATTAEQGDAPGAAPLGVRGVLSILAFWIWLPLLLGALGLIFTGDSHLPDLARFAGVALVFAGAWTAVTVVVFRLTTRFSLENADRLARNVVLVAAGILSAAAVGAAGAAALLASGFRPPGDGAPPSLGEMMLRMLFPNLLVYAGIAVTGLARDASLRSRARREQAVKLQAHNAQLQAQLAEARLRVLHTQLNPHFLFNTLNAVSGLMDEDPRGSRRMIARLSELLRYALRDTTGQEIPLEEELKLVGRYLEIAEIRFQGRLATSVEAEPGLSEALVPSLVLQPLAENAMKHGVGKAGGHGRIEVRASRSGDGLVLRVIDSGPGTGPGAGDATEGAGLGLRHTRERLAELYGDDQRFTLTPTPEGGMVAEIVLPYHTAPRAVPA